MSIQRRYRGDGDIKYGFIYVKVCTLCVCAHSCASRGWFIWSCPDQQLSLVCPSALLWMSQHTNCSKNQIGHHDVRKKIVPVAMLLCGSEPSRRMPVGRTGNWWSGSATKMVLGRLAIALRFMLSSPSGINRCQIMPCQPRLCCHPPTSSWTLSGCNLYTFIFLSLLVHVLRVNV